MDDDVTGEVGWVEHGTRRQRPRSSLTRYLVLFVTILLGVAGGILLANWVTATVAQAPPGSLAEKAGHVVNQIGSEISSLYRQATAKVTGQRATEDRGSRGSRASSETGRNLARQCEDWRRAYAQGHSPTARAEMERSCLGYDAYLDTGVAPP